MAPHDSAVKKQMGEKAFAFLLDEVSSGVILDKHMADISSKLHKHVGGNHIRRVESGKDCDEAEFRRILGDWYEKEMHEFDQKTILGRLIEIFKDPNVGIPVNGKKLGQFSEISDKDSEVTDKNLRQETPDEGLGTASPSGQVGSFLSLHLLWIRFSSGRNICQSGGF